MRRSTKCSNISEPRRSAWDPRWITNAKNSEVVTDNHRENPSKSSIFDTECGCDEYAVGWLRGRLFVKDRRREGGRGGCESVVIGTVESIHHRCIGSTHWVDDSFLAGKGVHHRSPPSRCRVPTRRIGPLGNRQEIGFIFDDDRVRDSVSDHGEIGAFGAGLFGYCLWKRWT